MKTTTIDYGGTRAYHNSASHSVQSSLPHLALTGILSPTLQTAPLQSQKMTTTNLARLHLNTRIPLALIFKAFSTLANDGSVPSYSIYKPYLCALILLSSLLPFSLLSSLNIFRFPFHQNEIVIDRFYRTSYIWKWYDVSMTKGQIVRCLGGSALFILSFLFSYFLRIITRGCSAACFWRRKRTQLLR